MNFWDSPPMSLDGKTIKIIAIITMFIDHMTCCFMEVARTADGISLMYAIPYGKQIDTVGRAIGRCAFPVFCFMLVEGYIHTRSRAGYLMRLLFFAAVSQVPFNLIFFPSAEAPHSDTIFTLSIGFVMIWGIDLLARILLPESYHPVPVDLLRGGADRVRPAADKLKKRLGIPLPRANANGKNFLPLILFLAGAALLINGGGFIAKHFGCDYSYGGIGTIALLYIFYKVRPLSLLIAWIWLTAYNNNELLAITGFWLIWCYNGRRGRQNKYFFYVFYPAHLMLLYLIRRQIFGV